MMYPSVRVDGVTPGPNMAEAMRNGVLTMNTLFERYHDGLMSCIGITRDEELRKKHGLYARGAQASGILVFYELPKFRGIDRDNPKFSV